MKTDRLRTINTPRRVEVELGVAGLPVMVERRAVESVGEIWRIDDEWWREHPIARMYYALILDDGTLLTVYHDLASDTWFEQRS